MKRLHLIGVFLIAIAIGFVTHAVRHSEGEATAPVSSGTSPSKSRKGPSFAHRAAAIQSLTRGVTIEGGEEEWFRWLASLENASLADLPQFVAFGGKQCHCT